MPELLDERGSFAGCSTTRHTPVGQPLPSLGRVPVMTQPLQPLLYCATCWRSAISMAAAADRPSPVSDPPQFMPVAVGPIKQHQSGGWQVPIARAIMGGESVCMFHLMMPGASNLE